MKALITGDQGFIGSHFAHHLSELGWSVLGCDIKHGMDCRTLFQSEKRQFDLVIHAAAIVGGRETIENEPLTVATDLAIDADFFNWATRTHQPKLVYFSSSAAYPTSLQGDNGRALRESDIDVRSASIGTPDMTYGWSKLTGELLATHARDLGTSVHVFRPFSGYGPRQDLTYPFPSFIQRVKNREDPFPIWGSGTQVRDFIHVDNIINTVMTSVKFGFEGPMNVCSGIGTTFDALAAMMFDVSGWHPKKVIHLTNKPTGVQCRVGNPTNMVSSVDPISLREGISRCL